MNMEPKPRAESREPSAERREPRAGAEPFTIGIIQDSATPDLTANLRKTERLVREAAHRGAQIVCLKELFQSPYFCKSQQVDRFDLAESIPGPSTSVMQRLAKELALVIVVPVFERQAAGLYRNSAAIIDADGSLLGVYRKMHIPDDPLFYEKCRHAGRSVPDLRGPGRGLQSVGDPLRDDRRPHLLGPVVPGGCAHYGAPRRAGVVLSDGDRVAPGGTCRMGAGTGGGLAHGPTGTRHRERRLRRLAELDTRRAEHERHRSLAIRSSRILRATWPRGESEEF
jgi:hypothetical protein